MTKLLQNNEKVLFVIHADDYKQRWAKDLPPLLQFKIEAYFTQLHQQGLYQDLSHFQVVEVDIRKQSNFDQLFQTYSDFHFFVDEVEFHENGRDGVSYDRMAYWSQKIPPNLHCWIAICYNK